ncbi:hypothetical protein [Cellulosilyticum sp. I15G10I2]|uniref:hypothetical protein n=1 Tax=Cellulosilyticum sp. I15G10I2 TaxID=1892843 RepID=UPI00085BEC3A|nr:hypothetical protein [Cellulosilyticum sp. I15G10I2]
MFKTSKIIYNILQVLTITYIIYFLIFIIHHFFIPNIGELTIESLSDSKDPEIKEITVSCEKAPSKYYIFIYEEDEKNNWIYFVHQAYDKNRQAIADKFLPKKTMKYVLFEGNKKSSSFQFQIKPKYPISYIARKRSVFHAIYLVPYKIYPFPEFYYCKHSIFYIDALK